jgi:hypothetical protein
MRGMPGAPMLPSIRSSSASRPKSEFREPSKSVTGHGVWHHEDVGWGFGVGRVRVQRAFAAPQGAATALPNQASLPDGNELALAFAALLM